MQALFGDLCSESHFDHDRQLKVRLESRNNGDVPFGSRKRKREDQQETQETENSHDVYETADGSIDRHAVELGLLKPASKGCTSSGSCHISKRTGKVLMAQMNPNSAVDEQDAHIDTSAHAGSISSEPAHKGPLPPLDTVPNPGRIFGNAGGSSFIEVIENRETCSSSNSRLQAIKKAFEDMNPGINTCSGSPIYISDEVRVVHEQDGLPEEDSQHQTNQCCVPDAIAKATGEAESQWSLTTSAFESQRPPDDTQNRELLGFQLDGAFPDRTELLRHRDDSGNSFDGVPQNRVDSEPMTQTTPSPAESKSRRLYAIKEAYRSARRCLLDGADIGSWEDLGLRSVGRKGHIEEELEL
jgi:hypothetical protein